MSRHMGVFKRGLAARLAGPLFEFINEPAGRVIGLINGIIVGQQVAFLSE